MRSGERPAAPAMKNGKEEDIAWSRATLHRAEGTPLG
jgi:hypothetical protein